MLRKVFLHLLILFGIWSQGIIGTFADDEIQESSDFLVRQKRVISYVSGEDVQVPITDAPYVVNIKETMRIKCMGNILSRYVVITTAECVSLEPEHYKVVSSTARLREGRHFQDVLEIRKRMDNTHTRALDGLGLLIVHPPFVFNQFRLPINLHTGPLLPGTIGKIRGWGYNFRSDNRGTNIPIKLRSIDVPIISHQNCVNAYRPHLAISANNVCTYHPQKHSGHIDFGAGLVVGGNLAGVFLWSGLIGQIDSQYPDVFVNLQDSLYSQWISTNLRSIDLHFQTLPPH